MSRSQSGEEVTMPQELCVCVFRDDDYYNWQKSPSLKLPKGCSTRTQTKFGQTLRIIRIVQRRTSVKRFLWISFTTRRILVTSSCHKNTDCTLYDDDDISDDDDDDDDDARKKVQIASLLRQVARCYVSSAVVPFALQIHLRTTVSQANFNKLVIQMKSDINGRGSTEIQIPSSLCVTLLVHPILLWLIHDFPDCRGLGVKS